MYICIYVESDRYIGIYVRYLNTFEFQNVKVSHAACDDLKAQMFGGLSSFAPCIGPDGMPMKTSACNDIEESVQRAANIEQQLASAKVNYSKEFRIYLIGNIVIFFDKS